MKGNIYYTNWGTEGKTCTLSVILDIVSNLDARYNTFLWNHRVTVGDVSASGEAWHREQSFLSSLMCLLH